MVIVSHTIYQHVLLQVIEAQPPPKKPGPKATKEEGSVVIEGAELFSKKQQREEEAALNKSMETVVFDTPSSSSLEQGVPSVVVTYTLFDTSPVITVLNQDVSHS